MARDGFLDENRQRGYPLLAGVSGIAPPEDNPGSLTYLPHDAIVDFGAIFGLDSGYIEGTDSVYLYSVSRSGDTFTFDFRSTASGLENAHLVFTRSLSGARYTVNYVNATAIEDSLPSGCTDQSIWGGFMISGDLHYLATFLSTGNTLTGGGDYQVEPGLLVSLISGYVRSVNVVNTDRTRAQSPNGCVPYTWPFALEPLYIVATCIQGPIRFQAGYNASVTVNARANSITFGAGVGLGAGEACTEVPIFPDEASLMDGLPLTGGPLCNGVVRAINGIGGPAFTIAGGLGVSISVSNTEDNTINVNVNFAATADCAEPNGADDSCDEDPPVCDKIATDQLLTEDLQDLLQENRDQILE